MKRTLLTGLVLILAGLNVSYAQQTVIRATVSVEKQVIRTGPYARFAQKYLGVVAPLADKQLFTITDAQLSYFQEGEASAANSAAEHICKGGSTELSPVSHSYNPVDFTKVPVDKMDVTVRSLEESAREAANKIFTLRKARIELITGLVGENIFGEGLSAALAEIDRLEEEYLALFMGKIASQTIVRTFDITPMAEETSRVVCRFSDVDGLLSESDLSGSPIVLEMKPIARPVPPAAPAKQSKNDPPMVQKSVPAQVNCRLTDGKNELAALRVPIYQMGFTTLVPVQ